MKRYLYSLCFFVAVIGITACSKSSDPVPDPPVVGKWTADYVLWSGLVAPYTSANGQKVNPLVYGISESYEIKSDKTFIYTDRSSAVIQTYPGTWDYSGTALSLKFDDGDQGTLNYDATGTVPHLATAVIATQDSLTNPTTNKPELVKFNVQLVYTK